MSDTAALLADLASIHDKPAPPSPYWMRGLEFYGERTAAQILERLIMRFRSAHRYEPDLRRPQTFSEYLLLQKFFAYWPQPSVADKLYAHAFATRLCGPEATSEIVWYGERFADFYDAVVPPGEYILKANHGSNMGRRLTTPADTDEHWDDIIRQSNEWLGGNFGYRDGEWQYSTFKRYLFLERAFEDDAVSHPHDYKFYCSNGRCRLIHVDQDRYTDFKCSFFTPQWEAAEVRLVGFGAADVERPENLGAMIEMVERLASDFPFARVDLYNLGGRTIKFGEITLIPGNGMERFVDYEMDRRLGQLLFAT